MFSVLSAATLFVAVTNADDKGVTSASIGAAGAIAGGILAIIAGRRRAELTEEQHEFARLMVEEANKGICAATSDMFGQEHMAEFVMSLLKKGDNGPRLEGLAEEVTEWCSEQSQLGRRRLGEDQSLEAQFVEFGRTLQSEDAFRRLGSKHRRGSKHSLPAHMFEQCSGYAAVMAQLIKQGEEDGAVLFGASSNGSGKEKTHGCESVVESVNRAVIDGDVPGVSVVTDDNDVAIVVAEPSLADQLGKLAMAVTLASGTVVYKLMNLCEYYN